MKQRYQQIWTILCVLALIGFSALLTVAQSTNQKITELEIITPQNAKNLEQWIPFDDQLQWSLEWIPMMRGNVRMARLSPMGDVLAIASSTGLYLLSADNQSNIPVRVEGIDDSVSNIIFSPHGTKIGFQTGAGKLYVYQLDEQQLTPLTQIPYADSYSHLQFDDNSMSIYAAAYGDNKYYIVEWNASTGRRNEINEIPAISKFLSDNRRVSSVEFDVIDNGFVTTHPREATLSNSVEIVQVWDKSKLTESNKLTLSADVSFFYYLPQYELLITSGYANAYKGALVWNTTNGNLLTRVATDGRIHLNSDQSEIWFYESEMDTIRVWDIERREMIQEYVFETGQTLDYVSDTRLVSHDSGGNIYFWKVEDGVISQQHRVEAFTGIIGDMALSSSGDQLVVAVGYDHIQIWDTNTWKVTSTIAMEQNIRHFVLSPDDQTLALSTYEMGDNRIQLRTLETGERYAYSMYDRPIDSMVYHPSGDYIATGRAGFDVAMYSGKSVTMLYRFVEGGIPYAVAFSPDGNQLASGNADGLVRVYNMQNSRNIYTLDTHDRVYSIAYSPDAEIMAVGSLRLSFYDPKNGDEIFQSDILGTRIEDMAFSPDGTLLATVRDTQFELWNVATRRVLWSHSVGSGSLKVKFHPDGNLILLNDAGLSLWVINTGEDTDGDGVEDVKDGCPTQIGSVNGCPDSDGDGLSDMVDVCPDEFGFAAGCPDDDGDGVPNADDLCPIQVGHASASGCPDDDRDGVSDFEDACLMVAGVPELDGCPDADIDGIADADDACPIYAGQIDNLGCPQVGFANAVANVRTIPTTNGAIVTSLASGTEVYIIAQNTTGDWLQIGLEVDDVETVAWIYGTLINTDIDRKSLPIQE